MRTLIPPLLALLFTGCAREQAVSAANIDKLASRIPMEGRVTPGQAHLLAGIQSEATAVHKTLDAEAKATVPDGVAPEVAHAEADRHAQTVTPPGGAVGSAIGDWLMAALGATTTVLGIIGGVKSGSALVRARMQPLVAAATAFGDDMKAGLTQIDPAAAKKITTIHAKKQEAAGIRLRLHTARGKPGDPPSVDEIKGR